jgi:four helix bundle protein
MNNRLPAKTFRDLDAWKKSHEFVLNVYSITKSFPKDETFGLTSQFRRAAVSIAANIAEGFRKRGKADKMRMFNIAEGSLDECVYYCILSKDLGYPFEQKLIDLTEEISKLLSSYVKAIDNSRI